ncbi:hypothetical protein GBA52_021978 [Prunus armeniaca]|nr:hypothetical protein GBA52_021978 [Prunus armeniaca]
MKHLKRKRQKSRQTSFALPHQHFHAPKEEANGQLAGSERVSQTNADGRRLKEDSLLSPRTSYSSIFTVSAKSTSPPPPQSAAAAVKVETATRRIALWAALSPPLFLTPEEAQALHILFNTVFFSRRRRSQRQWWWRSPKSPNSPIYRSHVREYVKGSQWLSPAE